MRVVNKLTKPGGIRRVDLTPDTVHIQLSDGQERVYRLASEYNIAKERSMDNVQETVTETAKEQG